MRIFNLFHWLERTLVFGDVIHDYGEVGCSTRLGTTFRTSMLLCSRSGRLLLVYKTVGAYRYMPALGVQYALIDVTRDSLSRLSESFAGLQARVSAIENRNGGNQTRSEGN
jgi:hypothetical protein